MLQTHQEIDDTGFRLISNHSYDVRDVYSDKSWIFFLFLFPPIGNMDFFFSILTENMIYWYTYRPIEDNG